MANEEEKSISQKTLLGELGSEVSQESAPLLEFITTHGGKIAGFLVLFLGVVGASGLWQWYKGKQQRNFLEERARIENTLNGKEKLQALEQLVDKVPTKLMPLFALTVAENASSQKDYATAETYFARVAKADADGRMGLMALLAQAACLLHLDKNAEALTLLESMESTLPEPKPQVFLQLMADAAVRSGNDAKAAQIYSNLAKVVTGDKADYLESIAQKLAKTQAATNK